MKVFFKLITVFLLPIFLVGISVELLERNIPNSYQLKDRELKKTSSEIETLILGSSHAYYGLNPNYFEKNTFNFAGVSQSIDIDRRILETYEPKLKNLKNVIIRLSYTTLFEQLKETSEKWRIKDYEIYTEINLSSNMKYQSELFSMKLENNLDDIFNYYIYKENLVKTSNLGWGEELNGQAKSSKQKMGEAIAKKHSIANKEYFEANKETLASLIKYCQQNNVNVYLITFPAHQAYVSNLESEQLNLTVETGKLMQANYSNCYYYNFLKSESFNSEDFYDVDHLNHQGAKKMSLTINEIINQH